MAVIRGHWLALRNLNGNRLGMIRSFLTAFFAIASVIGSPGTWAQTYPSKPIRLIIPFPPGGATDIIGRTLAQKLSTQLGQTVIVDNKPGAGGTLGSTEASKAAPDGYTLLLATTSTHSIAPSLYKNIGYSADHAGRNYGRNGTV